MKATITSARHAFRRHAAGVTARRAAPWLGGAIGLCLLFSCATPLPYEKPADPLELLSPDAMVYLRLRGPSLGELAPALLGESLAKRLEPIVERTDSLALAVLPGSGGIEAVLLGRYPFGWARYSLSRDEAWRPEGQGFRNDAAGLAVAFPGPDLVLASTAPLEPLLGRLSPGAARQAKIPAGLAAEHGRDEVFAWAPEPFTRLLAPFLGDRIEVPAKGLIVAARREGKEASNYELTVAFLMKDGDSARIYRPAVRLGWYAASRFLLPGNAAAPALRFESSGELIRSEPLVLGQGELAALLGHFGKGKGGSAKGP